MRTEKQQQKELAVLREKFPVGTRVVLTREFNRMPKGVGGSVTGHGRFTAHPWMAWIEVRWEANDEMNLEEAELCLEAKE